MRPQATCSHPGCGRPATEIAVVESEWEDASNGSALMVCAGHAESYLGTAGRDGTPVRAHRARPLGNDDRPTAEAG